MIKTTIDTAPQLSELVEAALRGEEVLIAATDEHGERLVRLVVADSIVPKRRTPGSAAGLIWMSDDFDEPLEEFEEYMR